MEQHLCVCECVYAEEELNKKEYVSKRLKCEYCTKKFNKKETFNKHMQDNHKSKITQDTSKEKQSNVEPNSSQLNSNQSINIKMTFQRQLRNKKKTDSANTLKIN